MAKLLKKVCLLGSPSVGKTSLVRRFVDRQFEEEYLSTIGVLISQKLVELPTADVELILWDIEGPDMMGTYPTEYLLGAAAFFFVSDITRPETVEFAANLYKKFKEQYNLGDKSFFAVNKCDLLTEKQALQVRKNLLDDTKVQPDYIKNTSAKADTNVTDLFEFTAQELVATFNS